MIFNQLTPSPQEIKHAMDAVPVPTVILYWLGIIPEVLASLVSLAALVWYGIRFYEWWKGKKNGTLQ